VVLMPGIDSMAVPQEQLELGKEAYFVRIRLLRLPQTEDEWQVDSQPFIPRSRRRKQEWLGILLSQTEDLLLADPFTESPPTVSDLARPLADAMRCPIIDRPHRPKTIIIRDNPTGRELLPHLRNIKIEFVIQEALPQWDKEFRDWVEEMR
jgi:hypothetical protein